MPKENQKQRIAQWRILVDEQQKSGLSQKEFCKQRNIILSKFVYYRGQLKDKNDDLVMNAPSFSPVKISNKESIDVSSEIKLSLPNGFRCSFSAQLDSSQMKRLIEVLLAC